MFDWVLNASLICSFILPCSFSFLESLIEYENAVENTRICSSGVFTKLLLPRIAQSLRNIIDILLSYVLLSYVLLRYLTYLFYLVLLTQKNITGQK